MPADDVSNLSHCRSPDYPQMRFSESLRMNGVVDSLRSCVVALAAEIPDALDTSGLIHVVQSRPIAGIATGTLFKTSNCHFLVTASHVFKDWRNAGWRIRIGAGSPERFLPFIPNEDDIASDDDIDVAVVKIIDTAVPFFAGRVFLTDERVDNSSEELGEGNAFLIPGYLDESSAMTDAMQSYRLHNYNLWVRSYSGNLNTSTFGRPEFGWLDCSGGTWCPQEQVPAPNPASLRGMSGANVWRVFHDSDVESQWDHSKMRVVGVQTSVFDDRVIRFARWKWVLGLVEKLLKQ